MPNHYAGPRSVPGWAGRDADRVLRGALLGAALRGRHPGTAGTRFNMFLRKPDLKKESV